MSHGGKVLSAFVYVLLKKSPTFITSATSSFVHKLPVFRHIVILTDYFYKLCLKIYTFVQINKMSMN